MTGLFAVTVFPYGVFATGSWLVLPIDKADVGGRSSSDSGQVRLSFAPEEAVDVVGVSIVADADDEVADVRPWVPIGDKNEARASPPGEAGT